MIGIVTADASIGQGVGDEGSGSLLTVLIALVVNVMIAILKSGVAAMTGSASMVAEATHSWADAGNEVFLLVAERRSGKPASTRSASRHEVMVADASHPLGYGRAAYVWSMVAAFGLFAVGAAVSVIHGINALSESAAETNYLWAFVVLGGAFVLEGVSFLQARRQLRAAAALAEMGRLDYLSKTSNPTLRAVFFEDAAALAGILIAMAGIGLHHLTGNAVWDAVGSILVGLLLGVIAVYLLARNMAFLVGQVADERYTDAILVWLLARPEVQDVTYLHLEYVGPQKIFVVGAVDLADNNPENEAAVQLQALENSLEGYPAVARAVLSLAAPGQAPLRPLKS